MRITHLLLTLLVLAGCQTTDPYTREKKVPNAISNAAVGGALLGTMTLLNGALSGDSNAAEKAFANAAWGATAGLISGASLDAYEKELLQEFRAAGVKIAVRQHENVLVVEEPITFAKNSSTLRGKSRAKAQAIGKVLAKYNKRPIDIIGHTAPGESTSLSKKRANSVAATIRKHAKGLSISTSGQGAEAPVGDNSTETGRGRNRRVTVFIRIG